MSSNTNNPVVRNGPTTDNATPPPEGRVLVASTPEEGEIVENQPAAPLPGTGLTGAFRGPAPPPSVVSTATWPKAAAQVLTIAS